MTVPTEFFRRLSLPCRGLGLAALLALAACGGGDREVEYKPTRLIVFGDEVSYIEPADIPASGATPLIRQGSRYTVNALITTTEGTPPVTTTRIDCGTNRIWVQQLATFAGLALPGGCLAPGSTTTSLNYATPDTGVAGVAAQIQAHVDGGGTFSPSDLVTVYTGTKDVIEIYGTVTSAAECRFDEDNPANAGSVALVARVRGAQLATQVNRIADNGRGGRVLFVSLPSVGSTPWGLDDDRDTISGVEGSACLRQLTLAFNAGLRSEVIQDGRYVGLLQMDERVGAAIRGFYGLNNVIAPVCNLAPGVPVTACTTLTLVDPDSDPATTTNPSSYLWADELHFGITMHNVLATLAISRAFDTNPF